MALKTGKNLASSRSEYNAYYDNMRGVDFTTDHSRVSNNRFAYLVNMFKNYRSEGESIETIPGYGKIPITVTNLETKNQKLISTISDDGRAVIFMLTNAANHCYAYCIAEAYEDLPIKNDGSSLIEYTRADGSVIYFHDCDKQFYLGSEKENEKINTWFEVNGAIYIVTKMRLIKLSYEKDEDGKYGVEKTTIGVQDNEYPYVPTTYINLPQSGWQQDENNAYGAEYEQRNLLTSTFMVTYISDGSTFTIDGEYTNAKFVLPETPNGLTVGTTTADINGTQYVLQLKTFENDKRMHPDGYIELTGFYFNYPKWKWAPIDIPKGTKITVTLSKTIKGVNGASDATNAANLVLGCTKACLYDNRVFLTGNPACPNHIFWSGFNAETGAIEPTYFGILDNMYDGIGGSKITGIMPVAETLVVLKSENNEGTMYFHTPYTTGEDIQPKIYPSARGISSAGCIGDCINFLDDPVFISRLGLEGIDKMSAGLERTIGHRSSNVDAVLLKCDLSKAKLAEWDGYLLLLADGQLFMADSRQRFQHHTGSVQYEWYYIDTVGEWVGAKEVKGKDNKPTGELTGGEFSPAVDLVSVNGNVYFVTERGNLLMFNFDGYDTNGELDPSLYTFDGHRIKCGVAFKMDNVGIPHLTKTTIKKSTVIKMKPLRRSSAKVKVRSNRVPYHELNKLYSVRFDFNDIEFSDFAFLDGEQSLFVIYEKEKKWVEKQYYIYSDEFCRPFALYSLAFRYYVAGRYKEK